MSTSDFGTGASFALAAALAIGALSGCHGAGAAAPHGLGFLRREGRFDAFLERATRESEVFRRRIVASRPNSSSGADHIARAIVAFRDRAGAHLDRRLDVDSFRQDAALLVERMRGRGRIDGEEVYGDFEGLWYGLWDGNRVDHNWSDVVELDPPLEVAIEGGPPVRVRSWQYAWVGDGYGLNLVATVDGENDFLLGYVVHVEDGDLDRERMRRPHVGIPAGPGRLIWLTAGEVFLEESFTDATGQDAYAITGFFYDSGDDGRVTARRAFQAVYSRDAQRRVPWFGFEVEVDSGR